MLEPSTRFSFHDLEELPQGKLLYVKTVEETVSCVLCDAKRQCLSVREKNKKQVLVCVMLGLQHVFTGKSLLSLTLL